MASDCVIQSPDLPSIYEVPVNMLHQGLDTQVLKQFGINPADTAADMEPWLNFLNRRKSATRKVNIALVGKYDLQDASKSITEAISQAGTYKAYKVRLTFENSEFITADNVAETLGKYQGVIICPGFGNRGIEGKIIAAQYCRELNVPTLGICLGMQIMAI